MPHPWRLPGALLVACLAVPTAPAADPDPPRLPDPDRVRLAEAFRLADAVGGEVWPGWDKAPFAVLLVAGDHEFLVRHPKPSDDFRPAGGDAVAGHKVWFRKRTYPTGLLATFPAVGGVPTVVIGRAEATAAKTSTRWVVTVLHEHFHQLQNSRPGYYAGVERLGLARGDKTGMWMLDYDFPYADPAVGKRFSDACRSLADALAAKPPEFDRRLASYRSAKKDLRSLLKADDYKYLSFQLWQEGVARYTELRVVELAAEKYEPTAAFRALKDYTPFGDEARAIRAVIEAKLKSVRLDKAKRTAFYPLGAAEALLLDRTDPGWRDRYFEEMFTLDPHFPRVTRDPE